MSGIVTTRLRDLTTRLSSELCGIHRRIDGQLATAEKVNLPAAINELAASIGSTVSVPADSQALTAIAGEILGGDRAVFVSPADGRAYHADNAAPASRLLCGLTLGAAMLAAPVTIQVSGVVQNASWAWSGTSPVYLGSSGLLTQTPPSSGYLIQVGTPVGAAKLRIEPQFVALI